MILKVYMFDNQGNATTLDKAVHLNIQIDHLSLIEVVAAHARALGKVLAEKDKEQ